MTGQKEEKKATEKEEKKGGGGKEEVDKGKLLRTGQDGTILKALEEVLADLKKQVLAKQ